jgi:hypothetical protein
MPRWPSGDGSGLPPLVDPPHFGLPIAWLNQNQLCGPASGDPQAMFSRARISVRCRLPLVLGFSITKLSDIIDELKPLGMLEYNLGLPKRRTAAA